MLKPGLSLLLFLCLLLAGLPAPAQDTQKKAQTLFDLGVFAYENGDYKTAENHFKQALSFDSDNANCNYYLGKLYLTTGNYSRAAMYFDKTRKIFSQDHTRKVEEELPDLGYYWAYLNYKMKNYATSYQQFLEVTAEHPGNVLAKYYAGMSLYKQQKHAKAVEYLAEAARMSPTIRDNATYYSGICYLQNENIEAAEKNFLAVRKNTSKATLRRAAENQLEKLRKLRSQRRRYTLKAKVGWEYDDNEVLEPIDNNDLYAEEEDQILRGYLYGSYNFIQQNNFVAGAGYGHYYTKHEDFEELDLSGSLFDLYTRYSLGNYTFCLSYNPDYYWLDSSDYLRRHELKATIIKDFGRLLMEFAYTHQRDDYMYNKDMDAYANEGFLRGRYTLPKNIGSLRAGIGFQDNSAYHQEYDYDRLSTELASYFNLWWGLRLGLSGECEKKKYDHPHPFYRKIRDDTKYTGNLLLSRHLKENLITANFGYEYTKNNSNIDKYEYESNAIKLFLTVKLQ